MLISAGVHYCEKIQNNSGSFKMIGAPLLYKVFLGVFFHVFFQIFHCSRCFLICFFGFYFFKHFQFYTSHSTLYAPHFTNHLQHLWDFYPCFAILHYPFLSITSHPLANSLVPNPNERCSPLSHFTLYSPPTTVPLHPLL